MRGFSAPRVQSKSNRRRQIATHLRQLSCARILTSLSFIVQTPIWGNMLSTPQLATQDELYRWLYGRFRRPLLAYFRRRIGNRSEAEDLTQEVFVRLLAHASPDAIDNVDAFIFKIASNLLHDRNRRALRQTRNEEPLLDRHLIAELASQYVEDRTPERVLLGREALRAALDALDELGELTRNIFILSRLEKMKQRDIAVLYGIATSTVEKHVMRAMICLIARLGHVRR